MKLAAASLWLLLSLDVFGQGSVTIMRAPEETPAQAQPTQQVVQPDPATDPALQQNQPASQVPPTNDPASMAPAAAAPAESTPSVPDTHTLDELAIEELERNREKHSENFESMTEMVPDPSAFDPLSELTKLGHKNITMDTLLDEKVIPIFTRVLKESNMKDIPREDVKNMIQEKFKGHPFEKLMVKCPKCLEIFVDVVRDEHALPAMLQIFYRKQDMKKFGMIWIGCLIVLFFVKRKIIPKSWPMIKSIPASFLLSLGFTSVSFVIFYVMFTKETKPLVSVVLKHF